MAQIRFTRCMKEQNWHLDYNSVLNIFANSKKPSIRSLIGQEDHLIRTKWYCLHGGGGWITEYYVPDKYRQAVTKNLKTKFNLDVFWDEQNC